MIKETELSIGNFVTVEGGVLKVVKLLGEGRVLLHCGDGVQVERACADESVGNPAVVLDFTCDYSESELEPLQLTHDIVGKNFKWVGDLMWNCVPHNLWKLDDRFYMYDDIESGEFGVGLYEHRTDAADRIRDVFRTKCVHRLQNFMKSVGIDGEVLV